MGRKRKSRSRKKSHSSASLNPPASGSSKAPSAPEKPRAIVRRRWVWGIVGCVLLAAAVGLGLLMAGESRPACPLILLCIDTLRADRLPVYGYRKIETPAIDALTREGILFENAYTHVPLTLPSHASLLTGLLPPKHGVRSNLGFTLPAGSWTLAAELARSGYRTGAAISAAVLDRASGIGTGFEFYEDRLEPTDPNQSGLEVQRDGAVTVEKALEWVKSVPTGERDRIFLFVHIHEPHTPYTPPRKYYELYPKDLYDGEVAYSDEITGNLMQGLRRLGLYDSSLVVLLSDHGEALGQHQESTHGIFLYRETMHVPLIVKLPDGRGAGSRLATPVQLTDVAPTLLDWIGLEIPPGTDGWSLVPAMLGRSFPKDRVVYGESWHPWYHYGWKELYSATDAHYSYVAAPHEELYDLREDPEQLRNLLPLDERSATDRVRERRRAFERLSDALQPILATEPHRPGGTGGHSLDPKDRVADLKLYRLAESMEHLALYGQALEKVRAVLQGSPRMVDAWDLLSRALLRLDRPAEAAEALQRSLELDPTRRTKVFEMTELLIRLDRQDQAREQLEQAEPLWPVEARVRLAMLEARAGNREAARRAAASAARELPAAEAFVQGVLLHEDGQLTQALPLLREAQESSGKWPVDTLPHLDLYLADALVAAAMDQEPAERQGRLKEAEDRYKAELERHPDHERAALNLAALYHAQSREHDLHVVLGRLARLNPSSRVNWMVAGALRAYGMADKAPRFEKRARELESTAGA